MKELLTRAQCQAIDKKAIEEYQLPELILMEHAALAVANVVSGRFHSGQRGLIVAGGGNNGADAMAVGRLLKERGFPFSLIILVDSTQLKGSAKIQYTALMKLGVETHSVLESDLSSYEWIVDGLFGTGLTREVGGKFGEVISRLNQQKAFRIAVDIPSGLNADTGQAMGEVFCADATVTFGYLKQGLVTAKAADYCGEISCFPIQIPRIAKSNRYLIEQEDLRAFLPERKKTSHKGSFGHVYIWSSSPQTEGACLLASLGALRTGAGLTSIVSARAIRDTVKARAAAEVMCQQVNRPFNPSKASDILVAGPGMGTSETELSLLKEWIGSEWPLVLDADALTLIAQHDLFKSCAERKARTIFTPHPGEAARLLNCDISEIENNRYQSVERLQQELGHTVLLKGRGTLVCDGKQTFVVNRGNSIQAKGGSGDVLSGMIGALMAQGLTALFAGTAATFLHGLGAEYLADRFGNGYAFVASDIADVLSEIKPWK